MGIHETKSLDFRKVKSPVLLRQYRCKTGLDEYIDVMFAYIIPPIPPGGPAGIGGSGSGSSTNTHSVVSSMPAIEAAFSRAILATFAGSITPALSRFS
jgi:hypothetical protein